MRRVPFPASRGGRALLGFWAVLLLGGAALAMLLQWLGPPSRPARQTTAPAAATARPDGRTGPDAVVAPAAPQDRPAQPQPPAQSQPQPGPARPDAVANDRHDIPPPDPALLEAAPHEPGAMLPRIAPDGRVSRGVYVAPAPALPPGTKRVAILLDGLGLSTADSLQAIDQLPAAVSLAVSPYALQPGAVLEAARKSGHELLLSLPMEPANAPADSEGARALTEQVSSDEDARRLEWSLSRIAGYAGVTNALAGMDGSGFTGSLQFAAIARALAGRGLFYLDATPGASVPGGIAGVDADLRVDDPPDAASIDRQLARLEQIADSKGSAIGIAGPIFPVTIRRLADWTRALPTRGLVLVPVSSLVHPPEAALFRSVQ
jgi:uncharacterized protein